MAVRLVTASSGDEPPHHDGPAPPDAPDDDLTGWLRGLVWTLGPIAESTQVRSHRPVLLRGGPSGVASGRCVIANRQRAVMCARLTPSPLRNDDGFSWFPSSVTDTVAVVPARSERTVDLSLFVPRGLPLGTYRGTLIVLATFGQTIDLLVEIADDD